MPTRTLHPRHPARATRGGDSDRSSCHTSFSCSPRSTSASEGGLRSRGVAPTRPVSASLGGVLSRRLAGELAFAFRQTNIAGCRPPLRLLEVARVSGPHRLAQVGE